MLLNSSDNDDMIFILLMNNGNFSIIKTNLNYFKKSLGCEEIFLRALNFNREMMRLGRKINKSHQHQ